MTRNRKQRGSAIVEFSLAGVVSCFVLICTTQLAMGMWRYHTLALAVHDATRYVSVHGHGCTKIGYGCSITVANIASKIKAVGIGLPDDSLNITLTTDSGAETACAPLNSCYSTATVWPPSTNNDDRTGKKITISAQYQFKSALLFFWPGQGSQRFGAIWLPASSSQNILF